MDSSLFLILIRISRRIRSAPGTPLTPNGNGISVSRSYTTERSGGNLYSKISPLGNPNLSIVPELDKWFEGGKKASVPELQRIISDLQKRKRYRHALEVFEWMKNNSSCKFSARDRLVELDLISRVHGLDSAESYFNNMNDKHKNERTYAALLSCFVRKRLVDKSLTHMDRMKKMGFASISLPYNSLMSLYTNLGQYEKVPEVLNEMKKNGVSPDNFSYRICINSYGVRSDLSEMEKLLEEMENQTNFVMDWMTYATVANFYSKAGLIDKANTSLKKSEDKIGEQVRIGYKHLISLYASLGNKYEVLRLWRQGKDVKGYINRDYMTMMRSLVKLGEFEEAQSLLEEWESSGNVYDFQIPQTLFNEYCQKGLVERAETMLDDIMKRGKTPFPNSWEIVAAAYVNKHNMEKAAECMKVALSFHVGNVSWRPNPKVIKHVLGWLGDEGDVNSVEAFVGSLRTVIPMNREMYHALIKSNIRFGKEVDALLVSMKNDEIDEDEETKRILGLREVKDE